MAGQKTRKKTRIGRVTVYEHHGAWYTYHRQGGDESLPQRLIDAHMEIRPGPRMIQEAAEQGLSPKALRKRFKAALKELG